MAKTLIDTYNSILEQLPGFAQEAASIFEKMDWKWYDGVPNAERIQSCAYGLLWDAYKSAKETDQHGDAATGRICVTLNKYRSGWVGNLSLKAISNTR